MPGYSLSFSVLMPPTVFIVLTLFGAVMALRWRRLGLIVCITSAACLYVLSTPLCSYWLLASAAELPDRPRPPMGAAQAIVVLSGDVQQGSEANGSARIGLLTAERLMDAARLYRALHLPVLVSGGRVAGSTGSLAELMSETLENAFGVPVKWREEQAATTYENARNSARLLRQSGIKTVVVVTQAWHMPRALWSFEKADRGNTGHAIRRQPAFSHFRSASGP